MERGRAAWGRLQPVLDAPLSVQDHGLLAHVAPGALVLEGINFSYPGHTALALKNVSLSLSPGSTLGLVGPTGSGKSSVLRLILRQYAAQTGRIHWAGQALGSYQLKGLNHAISWVPQEPFLFSASIADNIALGKPDATRPQVQQAARLASIDGDIERMPQGFDTPVGEKGIALSGGQRQRVAIARALLSDATLLLMDDALSAVDTQTETDILLHLQEMRRARPDRASLIVSHRLSAVMDAQQILVLQHGEVVEQGSHAELLALGGWYAAQWQYQQLQQQLQASLDAA